MMRRSDNSQNKNELSTFKQDIVGIVLIAIAIFILVSNLSSSTGFVGLFFVKKFLKLLTGVGVYILPVLIVLLGITVMMRQNVGKITAKIIGFIFMFLVIVAAAQVVSPTFYTKTVSFTSGAGGVLGYGVVKLLLKTVGITGTYIFIVTVLLISIIFISNVTILRFFSVILKPLFTAKTNQAKKAVSQLSVQTAEQESYQPPSPKEPRDKSIQAQISVVKEFSSRKEVAHFVVRRRGAYQLPPLDLLDPPSQKEIENREKLKEATEFRKKVLEDVFKNFGVAAKVVSTSIGPAVTRFELQPEAGVKVSRIVNLSDDIALNLATSGVRMEAPVPGKSVIGIEVPNSVTTFVRLAELVKIREFQANPSRLLITIGKDIGGSPIFGDLVKMPHLLVAGTTGSGKSVCINSLILSILLRASPEEVKFMMIDPKMVELSGYNDIPHLLAPVVTDPKKAAITLREWAMKEMERRYKEFYHTGVRNIEAYNQKVEDFNAGKITKFNSDAAYIPGKLPYIVVIIDELADLMMVSAAEVETTICRIAQMARATGIHLVIATQRPSVDIITGLIKANIPSRIAFAVATQVDSRVIMDMGGAEKLLGRGDMLYHPLGNMKPIRVQGTFVSDSEVEKVVNFIKKQGGPEYSEEILALKADSPLGLATGEGGRDELFGEAAKIIIEGGQASTSHLQRRMRIGYNRAARIMDELTEAGIVSNPEGENKPRRILATRDTLRSMGIE